jgi:hypothetical protein
MMVVASSCRDSCARTRVMQPSLSQPLDAIDDVADDEFFTTSRTAARSKRQSSMTSKGILLYQVILVLCHPATFHYGLVQLSYLCIPSFHHFNSYMYKAKAIITSFIPRGEKHDTTVHEIINPAIENERVTHE